MLPWPSTLTGHPRSQEAFTNTLEWLRDRAPTATSVGVDGGDLAELAVPHAAVTQARYGGKGLTNAAIARWDKRPETAQMFFTDAIASRVGYLFCEGCRATAISSGTRLVQVCAWFLVSSHTCNPFTIGHPWFITSIRTFVAMGQCMHAGNAGNKGDILWICG
jgi:hypothetical protein